MPEHCDCNRKLLTVTGSLAGRRKSSSVEEKQKWEPAEGNVSTLCRIIVGCWNSTGKPLPFFFFSPSLSCCYTNTQLCRNIQASQVTVIHMEMLSDQMTSQAGIYTEEQFN